MISKFEKAWPEFEKSKDPLILLMKIRVHKICCDAI